MWPDHSGGSPLPYMLGYGYSYLTQLKFLLSRPINKLYLWYTAARIVSSWFLLTNCISSTYQDCLLSCTRPATELCTTGSSPYMTKSFLPKHSNIAVNNSDPYSSTHIFTVTKTTLETSGLTYNIEWAVVAPLTKPLLTWHTTAKSHYRDSTFWQHRK